MDFLRKHRKICSAVAALMVAVLVVYSYGSFRSYAAAPEVSTLPADIDIDVDYTSDAVNFTYAGKAYSIDRKHNVNLIHYSYRQYSSGTYERDYNQPETFECSFAGDLCYTSYWFSPSEMRIYVLMTPSLRKFSQVKSYIASSNYGTFLLVDARYSGVGFNSVFMTTIDYNSGSAVYNVMSSQEGISYWDAYSSNTKNYDDVYACANNINYFNYYMTGYLDDNYLMRARLDYKATGELNTSDYASNYHYIPNDLLCIFSNYEISGFYEPDTSKVNTPDYYFNFQYIFYKEGFGYIFVDSAKRCKEVGFPNGVTNPRFYFDGEGNNYVYTSVDGITWILKSAYNTMYNKYFEVSCGYEFTDYTLVYTNDKNFGTPLVTPSYGEISDVIGDLSAITNNYHDTINNTSVSLVDTPESNTSLWDYFASLEGGLLAALEDYSGFPIFSTLSSYMHSSDISDESVLLTKLLDNFTSDVSWYYDSSDSTLHTYTSLYGYVHHMYESIVDNGIYIESFMKVSHADLKSVFDNITLSNQYLKRIFDNLDSLSIPDAAPDYSGRFDKLSVALDKLHNDLIYEEGVTKLPNVPQYLVYVYSVTKDIRTKLDNINVQISDDIVTFRKAVISRFDPVTEKLDSIIAKIPSSSGGGNFDDSNMVGSIVSLKADISDNFTTLIKLLKNDTDGVENIADLTSFLTTYVVSMGNAAYFTTLLEFADGVKNNVTLINETMVTMVTDSGIFAPIFTLGAGFAVFSGLIRKERMN